MKTAIIIDYNTADCIKKVIEDTLNAIGHCRIVTHSMSIIGVNGTLTDEEKAYLQDLGDKNNVEYVFLECDDDYEGEKRTNTIRLS